MAPDGPLTPAMRDRQGRGKDPYAGDSAGTQDANRSGLSIGGGGGGKNASATRSAAQAATGGGSSTGPRQTEAPVYRETFELREKRQMAMSVLDSPDLLMLIAESENDSVAGQRQRFTRMLCGLDEGEDGTAGRRTPRKKDREQD